MADKTNKEMQNGNPMGYAPVKKLLVSMSVPLMISNLVQALYNIVDSFFVAKINEDALTAVTAAFPIQMLIISFSIGISVGMSALLSRYLGEGKLDKVNKVAHNGIILAAVNYLVFVGIGFLSAPFMKLMTQDARIIEYGTIYLSTVCWLSCGVMTQITFERMMQATGKTKYVFYTQASGAVVNMIMDPILIFGLCGFPEMGIRGAAVATIFGQIIGAALGFYFNHKVNKEIKLRIGDLKPDLPIIKEIYKIGVPSVIMQSVGSVMSTGLNKILFAFSSTAVATFGAYFKLQSFIFMPIFGLNAGVVPIAAFNYGSRNKARIQEVMSFSARLAVGIMTCGMLVFWMFPEQLLSIFSASTEMLRIGVPALRIIAINFPFAGYAIMRGAIFQAFGKSVYSMNISIVRQLVVLLPVAWLLSLSGEVTLVWWAFPIAEVLGTTMSVLYTKRIRRKIIDKI